VFFYRRYLALDPETPNRALVEQLIAESEKGGKMAPPPAEAAPAPAAAPPPPPPSPLAAAAAAEHPSAPLAVSAEPPPPRADEPPLFVKATPAPAVATAPLYKRWWFWATVGGVVAAGVATAVIVSRGQGTAALPSGNLSTINWR
jgi:hypothetical protein